MTVPARAPGKLHKGDVLFVALCLCAAAFGVAVVRWGFVRAFPEASIDFRVTGEEAREIAARHLLSRGFDVAGSRRLVLFEQDDDAKTYLERTLGLEKASRAYASVPVWRWAVRFVWPLRQLEYVVHVDPGGRVAAFRRVLPEKAPAPDPGDAGARLLAEEAMRAFFGVDPADRSSLRFVEATREERPARVDRTFVFESERIRHGDGALRYLVEVQGDRAGRCRSTYRVPEKWQEEYRVLRSKNQAASAVATLGLFVTALAVLGVLLERVRRKDVRWRTALAFGGAGFALQLAASLNELPVALYEYATSESWGSAVGRALLGGVGGAVTLGLVLVLLVAAGEPLYREAFPGLPALGRIVSLRALGTRSAFRGLLLGWTLTALFVAYQVLFYVGAERLGAWAPADVPYSNLLGTRFPWLAVLLAGFVPATTEEFSSRMFSIPFVRRFAPATVAVVLPALIWGFAHSAYPNQPFWIRGVEVGLAGVAVGVVFLKAGIFPLLVWHFTVDAVYTALILVRSSNRSFVVSGAIAAGVLLLPLVASVLMLLRRREFAPEEEVLNRSLGTEPAPGPTDVPPAAPPPRARSPRIVAGAAAASALLLLAAWWALPRFDYGKGEEYRVDRAGAESLAASFVRRSGDDPALYVVAAFHASALPSLDTASDSGAGLVPYEYSSLAERWLLERGGTSLLSRWATRVLPGRVWQVRFLRFGERRAWWVVVDGRSGAVVAYRRSRPEEEPGERPEEGTALAAGSSALRGAGLDPASFRVVSVKSEERKNRRDHRLVYESLTEAAGEARLRASVGLAGGVPSGLAVALKLPEEWVRERDRMRPATYAALAWKVGGLGVLLGLVVVELLRLARAGSLDWRRAARAAAWMTLPAALAAAVSFPEALRAADPGGMSLATFSVAAGVGFSVRLAGSFALFFVLFLLVLSVRPDAVSAAHWVFPPLRAAGAAAAALLVLAAGSRLGRAVLTAGARFAEFGGFPDPPSVDALVPAVAACADALRQAVLLGAAAAVAAILIRRYLTAAPARVAGALLALGLVVPLDPRTWGELAVPSLAMLVPALAVVGAIALLGEDPRAYWLAGLLAGLLPAAWKLASSGVPSWIGNGTALFVLSLAAAGLLLRAGPPARGDSR